MQIQIEDINEIQIVSKDSVGDYISTYTRLNDEYFKIEYSGYDTICKYCGEIKNDIDDDCEHCSNSFTIIEEDRLIELIEDIYDEENKIYINQQLVKNTIEDD